MALALAVLGEQVRLAARCHDRLSRRRADVLAISLRRRCRRWSCARAGAHSARAARRRLRAGPEVPQDLPALAAEALAGEGRADRGAVILGCHRSMRSPNRSAIRAAIAPSASTSSGPSVSITMRLPWAATNIITPMKLLPLTLRAFRSIDTLHRNRAASSVNLAAAVALRPDALTISTSRCCMIRILHARIPNEHNHLAEARAWSHANAAAIVQGSRSVTLGDGRARPNPRNLHCHSQSYSMKLLVFKCQY